MGREACGEFVVEAHVERFSLLECVLGGIDRLEKLNKDIARVYFEFALLHDAVSARAGDRYNRHAGLDRHYRSPLLKFLQTSIGAASSLRVNQEGLAVAKGLRGFLQADDRGIAIAAIDGNEMCEVEGLSDDWPFEKGALQKNGDASRDTPDDGWGIGGTRVIRSKDHGAGGDALDAFCMNADANASDEEHNAVHASPVERINVSGDQRVNEQRWSQQKDVEAQKYTDEGSAKHGQCYSRKPKETVRSPQGLNPNPTRRLYIRAEALIPQSAHAKYSRILDRWSSAV